MHGKILVRVVSSALCFAINDTQKFAMPGPCDFHERIPAYYQALPFDNFIFVFVYTSLSLSLYIQLAIVSFACMQISLFRVSFLFIGTVIYACTLIFGQGLLLFLVPHKFK